MGADEQMGKALDGLDGKVRESVAAAYRGYGGKFTKANLPALRRALQTVRRGLETRGQYRQADDLTTREDRLEGARVVVAVIPCADEPRRVTLRP